MANCAVLARQLLFLAVQIVDIFGHRFMCDYNILSNVALMLDLLLHNVNFTYCKVANIFGCNYNVIHTKESKR